VRDAEAIESGVSKNGGCEKQRLARYGVRTGKQAIALLGGGATWLLAPRQVWWWAQQAANTPIVRLLSLGANDAECVETLRGGLRDNGLIDGANVRLLARFAESRPDRLRDLARELAKAGSRVIVTSGTTAVSAVHSALPQMPVVTAGSADPVLMGFAKSLARPGGTVTGISILGAETLFGKNVELLKELEPSARAMASLLHAANPGNGEFRRGLVVAGRSANVEMHFREIQSPDEFANAFDWASRLPVDGVFVIADPVFRSNRSVIAQLAETKRLPWVGPQLNYARAGALAAYTFDFASIARDSARFVALILRGADPAELPIEQPTKFHLAINLKTAKSLGLEVPPTVLARADEVIE